MGLLLVTFLKLFIFIPLTLLVFYVPGRVLIGSKNGGLDDLEVVALSMTLGIILFVLSAILLGLLNFRVLSLPILLVIFTLGLRRYKGEFFRLFRAIFADKKLLLLLFLGILIQGFINFPSGFTYKEGIHFWSSQGHDGLWHVALMEEVKRNFPPGNPLYPGHVLQNYHYAGDILMGEFYRLFSFLNPLDLYFRYYPVLFSFLIGLNAFVFAKKKWNLLTAYWAVFFAYFCGSFGYIYLILKGKFPLGGETVFWASQNNTILGNPPHALGIIILTMIFFLLVLWQKDKKKYWLHLVFLLGGALMTFKVSSGGVLVAGLIGAGVWLFIKEKKLTLLALGIILAITNFSLLKLISPSAESFLVFEPLWFPRTMMVAKLDNVDWILRKQHYLSVGSWKAWLRIVQLELTAVLIFILGNTGARLIGLIGFWQCWKKSLKSIDIFLGTGMIFSLAVVLLFVQKGITYNLIQFMQIYFHILGFCAASGVVYLLSKIERRKAKILVSLIIILIALPTAIGNLFEFYGPDRKPLARVSDAELEAFDWIKSNTPQAALLLTKPFSGNAHYQYSALPLPIYAWYSTPYVFVFSQRYVFLTGEEQLDITGYNYKPDLLAAEKFFNQTDFVFNREFLAQENINYIYLRKDEIIEPIDEKTNNLELVFENQEIKIYEVSGDEEKRD
ncbi:MAG: hypothetical protein ABIB61_02205 [Candidatus Shapirobacteria bacterium]